MVRCVMRTTVTLDDDVRALVERAMVERRISFKAALNDAVRAGLQAAPAEEVHTLVRPMGARMDLTHATRLAAELEDEELVRKMATGK